MRILVSLSDFGAYMGAGLQTPRILTRLGAQTILQMALSQYPTDTLYECFCLASEREEFEAAIRKERKNVRIWSFSRDEYTGLLSGLQHIRDALPEDEEILLLSLDHVSSKDSVDSWIHDTRMQTAAASITTYTGFTSNLLTPDEHLSVQQTDRWVTHIESLDTSKTVPERLQTERLTGNVYFRIGRFLKDALGDVEAANTPLTLKALLLAHLARSRPLRTYTLSSYLSFASSDDFLAFTNFSQLTYPLFPLQDTYFQNTTCIVSLFHAGSQFQANGYTLPKPYLPIESRPMYCVALQRIPPLKELILVCDEQDATTYSVASVATESLTQPIRIETVSGTTMGQASTIERILLKGEIPLDEPLLLAACDVETTYHSSYLMINSDVDVILYGNPITDMKHCSNDQTGWIEHYTDNSLYSFTFKAPPPSERGTLCFTGTVWFRKASLFLNALQETYIKQTKTNGEYYIGNVIQTLIQQGVRISAVSSYGNVFRTPLEYERYHFWKNNFSTPNWGLPSFQPPT